HLNRSVDKEPRLDPKLPIHLDFLKSPALTRFMDCPPDAAYYTHRASFNPGSNRTMTVCYRAEQVGSLLRPPELLQARTEHAEGRLSVEELRSREDNAIAAALARQREIGIDIFTDGEMRRGSWLTDMADAVEGFVRQRVELEWKGPGGGREASSALAAGA